MSFMGHDAAFAPAGGIQELSFDEVDGVSGGVGVAGGVIGGVVGGLAGGYNYVAGHTGSSNGRGATFGGALVAIGSGMAGGAIAGATGTWAGAIVGAVVGVAGAYGSGKLDSQKNANTHKN